MRAGPRPYESRPFADFPRSKQFQRIKSAIIRRAAGDRGFDGLLAVYYGGHGLSDEECMFLDIDRLSITKMLFSEFPLLKLIKKESCL